MHNMPYSDQIIQDEKQYGKYLTVYQENCCNKKYYFWVLKSNRKAWFTCENNKVGKINY